MNQSSCYQATHALVAWWHKRARDRLYIISENLVNNNIFYLRDGAPLCHHKPLNENKLNWPASCEKSNRNEMCNAQRPARGEAVEEALNTHEPGLGPKYLDYGRNACRYFSNEAACIIAYNAAPAF